jgi:protein-S-isoprenylcysteine O-methyltransferase
VNAIPASLAAALVAFYLAFEGRVRVGDTARSLTATADDRGSTRRVGVVYGVAIVAFVVSTWLGATGVAALPALIAWAGVAFSALGVGLRFWSARVLGASYTRTLRVEGGQRLVRSGPYRVVRHPGYAGSMLIWTGAAFASGDVLGVVVIVPAMVWAYLLRIAAEERMLAAAFGDDFRDYARHTSRLVPFVF